MISFVYITNRYEPRAEWFYDSLVSQLIHGETVEVIIVAPKHSVLPANLESYRVEPKPTIWSGPHRLTKADWWSASNARNTGICKAEGHWIVFLDDRSVLLPGWMDCLRAAMAGNYMVCGTYEKVHNLSCTGGKVEMFNPTDGRDSRLGYIEKWWKPHFKTDGPYNCPGEWTYGCCLALPLEWALEVGGFEELCDSSSGEDYIFGLMLQNCGKAIKFDPRMKILEDRTPGHCEPIAIRKDKGVSPNDKSHGLLNMLKTRKAVSYPKHLRAIRETVLHGGPWPACELPDRDWWDGQPVRDME